MRFKLKIIAGYECDYPKNSFDKDGYHVAPDYIYDDKLPMPGIDPRQIKISRFSEAFRENPIPPLPHIMCARGDADA